MSLTPEKLKKTINFGENVQGTQYIKFRTDRSDWIIVIHYTSGFSSQISISVLQQFQIQALKQNYLSWQLAILDAKCK